MSARNPLGRKGGGAGSSPPPQRTPVEAANSLRSKATGRVVYAIAEGPCIGLVDGPKSIFLNDTPIQNADGSYNFSGLTWDTRTGTPDQSHMPGFPAVESENSVEAPLKRGQPVTRRLDNLNANAIRVTLTFSSLFDQNTQNGDVNGTLVQYIIRLKRDVPTSNWQEIPISLEGKQNGPYQEAYRLGLPGTGPWLIQVERLTPDSDRGTLQNSMTWGSFTEIIDNKFTYPNTGLLGLTFDAETFGNQVPRVTMDWKGWICKIPHNYDPVNRSYSGIFSGAMRDAWTDNPVWCFYTLLTHPRGANLPPSAVDVFQLYPIAQYCDQRVPDGKNGFEPRFSCNAVIATRQEAFAVINALGSCFRAMAFWSAGAVGTVCDMPRDPDVLVTRANTIGGFEYSGGAIKAIHTAAVVSFLDEDDSYNHAIETYENPLLIERYGYNPTEVTAFACTSRSQAHRLGKWLVETEAAESDGLTWKAGIDHLNVQPGSIAIIQDPDVAGIEYGGRISSATTTRITLDRPVTLQAGRTYRLKVVLPDLTVHERIVATSPGTTSTLNLASGLSQAPQAESPWVLVAPDLAPQTYRVIGVSEDSPAEYSIVAVRHDPNKFARIEQGLNLPTSPITRLPNPGVVQPPGGVTVDRQYVQTPGGWTVAIQLSWTASPDAYVRGYIVRYQRNSGGWQQLNEVNGTSVTLYGESHGRFVFHVQAVNLAGILSRPSILEINISDTSPISLVRPSGLELEGQGTNFVFQGQNPKFSWRATALRGSYDMGSEPAAGAGYLDSIFRDFEIRITAMNGQVVYVDHTTLTTYEFSLEKNALSPGGPHRQFKFTVYMRDRWGNLSLPATIEVVNPAPAQPTNLVISAGLGTMGISFDIPTDLDWAGTLVWVGTESGYNPDNGTLKYDGPDSFVFLNDTPGATRFVRVALYDSFGKTGLNVSSEYRVIVGAVEETDFLPPAVPTGLSVTSQSSTNADGSVVYKVIATWNANAEDDFGLYNVGIRAKGDVDFIESSTGNKNKYEWTGVLAGITYEVYARAIDKAGNTSINSGLVEIRVGGDSTPPATPTTMTAKAAFRTIWLEWPKPSDSDWLAMQVWESATNNRTQAVMVGRVAATTFAREDLNSGDQRWYWIRSEDRSGNVSNYFPASTTAGIMARTKRVEEADYAELSIGNAAIMDAAIDSAKVSTLDASKITANSVLSSTIRVGSGTGVSLGTLGQNSSDPAGAINSGFTLIDPGNIRVAGSTTLSEWRGGPSQTEINGGRISANSIVANKLTIGLRGIETDNLEFTANKATNTASWTNGWVVYPDDDGVTRSRAISAGSVQFSTFTVYIYWVRGSGQLSTTVEWASVLGNPNAVALATYTGGSALSVTYGRTLIDGDNIRTGSITASRLTANTITARELSTQTLLTNSAQIGAAVINSAHIGNAQINDAHINTLSANKITTGTIRANQGIYAQQPGQTGWVEISSFEGALKCFDNARRERVRVGHMPGVDYGLWVWNAAGVNTIAAGSLGLNVVGTLNLNGESVTTGKIAQRAVTNSFSVNTNVITYASSGAPLVLMAHTVLSNSGGPTVMGSNLMRDGLATPLRSVQGGIGGLSFIPVTFTIMDNPGAGTFTYRITGGFPQQSNMTILELKR